MITTRTLLRSFIIATTTALCATVAMGEDNITTYAGSGTKGYAGDGGQAISAQFKDPIGMAVDSSGNLYIADSGNHVVRRVDASTGVVTTYAGDGGKSYSGDGGLAIDAELDHLEGLMIDPSGNLFIADKNNHAVRRVDAITRIITTIAGTGSNGYSGDGGPATSAKLDEPVGLARDTAGNIFIAEKNNHIVRRVDAITGVISTYAGTGAKGNSGDGGLATSAEFDEPYGIAIDSNDDLFVTDKKKHVVRKVDSTTGIISTYAGTGAKGYAGDGGLATWADLKEPISIAFDASDNLYIASKKNHVIRQVNSSSGMITTFVGTGNVGYTGDGWPPTSATLDEPHGITIDADGNLYIADKKNSVIRHLSGVGGAKSIRVVTWQAIPPVNSN